MTEQKKEENENFLCNIQEYMEFVYPNQEYGCYLIGFEDVTKEQLIKEFSKGFEVKINNRYYWVWFL